MFCLNNRKDILVRRKADSSFETGSEMVLNLKLMLVESDARIRHKGTFVPPSLDLYATNLFSKPVAGVTTITKSHGWLTHHSSSRVLLPLLVARGSACINTPENLHVEDSSLQPIQSKF